MNGREHFRGFYLFIIPLVAGLIYLKMWRYIPLLLLSSAIYDADEDQKPMNGRFHRSFLTHSILWCIIITGAFYWFDLQLMMEGLFISSFAMIVHLFLDLFTKNDDKKYRLFGVHKHRVGKYCIKFYKKRLSGGWTLIWFITNIIIMVIYDVWFIKNLL